MKSNLMEILENDFRERVFVSRCVEHSALMSVKMAYVQNETGNPAQSCTGVLRSEFCWHCGQVLS